MKVQQDPPSQPLRFPRNFITGVILALICLWFSDWLPLHHKNEYMICSKLGSIYTVDENKPQVECIAIKGTRISDTGSLQELQSRRNAVSWLQAWPLTLLSQYPRVSYVDSNSIVIPGLVGALVLFIFSEKEF